MEQVTARFEAVGADGRPHTVLVYTTLTASPRGVAAGERLATADGLTVVRYGPGRFYVILTGAVLTRPGEPAAT